MAEDRKPKAPKAKPEAAKKAAPPPPPDEAPKPQRKRGPRSKAERTRADLKAIEVGFTELLVDTPAMIGGLTADPWLVDHSGVSGPPLVERLVAEAERSDRFREVCLRAVRGQSMMMLFVALGGYLGPIGLHYGVFPGAEQFGIPARRLPGLGNRPPAPQEPPSPPRRDNGGEPSAPAPAAEQPPAEAI